MQGSAGPGGAAERDPAQIIAEARDVSARVVRFYPADVVGDELTIVDTDRAPDGCCASHSFGRFAASAAAGHDGQGLHYSIRRNAARQRRVFNDTTGRFVDEDLDAALSFAADVGRGLLALIEKDIEARLQHVGTPDPPTPGLKGVIQEVWIQVSAQTGFGAVVELDVPALEPQSCPERLSGRIIQWKVDLHQALLLLIASEGDPGRVMYVHDRQHAYRFAMTSTEAPEFEAVLSEASARSHPRTSGII
jgi:hypothetical protein